MIKELTKLEIEKLSKKLYEDYENDDDLFLKEVIELYNIEGGFEE